MILLLFEILWYLVLLDMTLGVTTEISPNHNPRVALLAEKSISSIAFLGFEKGRMHDPPCDLPTMQNA